MYAFHILVYPFNTRTCTNAPKSGRVYFLFTSINHTLTFDNACLFESRRNEVIFTHRNTSLNWPVPLKKKKKSHYCFTIEWTLEKYGKFHFYGVFFLESVMLKSETQVGKTYTDL